MYPLQTKDPIKYLEIINELVNPLIEGDLGMWEGKPHELRNLRIETVFLLGSLIYPARMEDALGKSPLRDKVKFTHSVLYEFKQSKLDFIRNLPSWTLIINHLSILKSVSLEENLKKTKNSGMITPESLSTIKEFFFGEAKQP
jgi:hypothetical protein